MTALALRQLDEQVEKQVFLRHCKNHAAPRYTADPAAFRQLLEHLGRHRKIEVQLTKTGWQVTSGTINDGCAAETMEIGLCRLAVKLVPALRPGEKHVRATRKLTVHPTGHVLAQAGDVLVLEGSSGNALHIFSVCLPHDRNCRFAVSADEIEDV